MALLHVPLFKIDEAHLQALIDAKAAESRSIEYKRDKYDDCDAHISKFLADVSSFANTSGGDLIIGMAATDGIPTSFSPLDISMDDEKLRLEHIARTGLQPRITNIDFHPVPIERGRMCRRCPSHPRPDRKCRGSRFFPDLRSAGQLPPGLRAQDCGIALPAALVGGRFPAGNDKR